MTFSPPDGAWQRQATTPLQGSDRSPVGDHPLPGRERPLWPWTVATGLLVAALAAVLLLSGAGGAWQDTLRGGGVADGPTVRETTGKTTGAAIDAGWWDLTMVGGWVPTGDGARFRVVDGICYLQMHVKLAGGVWGRNSHLATLPRYARPAWHMGFVGTRDGLPFGEVKVFSDGRVFVVAPSDTPGGDITVSASFPVGP